MLLLLELLFVREDVLSCPFFRQTILICLLILCASESASSSKWHAWFASRCLGRRLSTWPTTAVSCPTALGALCGQLTFRLAWCREHSAVTAIELSQPRDLACGTLFMSSCVILTSPADCSDDRQLKGHLFPEA